MTYARFGNASYKYNDNTRLYGAGAETTNLIWRLLVDWDGDGTFDGSNDAIYMTDCDLKRGRDFYIKKDSDGKASGFEPMKVGKLKVALDNTNGRYDAYNTTSPLYPYILPGRYIDLSVNYNGTVYPVFAGKITDIQSEGGEEPKAFIEAEDGMRRLQDYDATVAVQTNIDVDEAIGLVLDDVDYPTLWGRNLEDSGDVLSYWWADDRAKTEIQRLADAEFGNFFVAADGAATFYSRHHTNTAVLTLTAADFLKRIPLPQPWDVVRNIIKVTAHPPQVVTSQTLWTLADKPVVKAGESFTVWTPYTYNGSAVSAENVIQPVATTDYTVNTAEDGSGTNLTASCTVTSFTDFGKTAKVVLTNGSAFDGYVTLEQVRGDAVTFPNASLQIAEDATSQATYDPRTLAIDSQWMQSSSLAADFAQYLASFLNTPKRFLEVQVEGRPDIQFTPDLLDVIDTTIAKLNVDDNYKVGSIAMKWLTPNGQAVLTTWKLEPFPDLSGYWQFTATIGQTTIFGI